MASHDRNGGSFDHEGEIRTTFRSAANSVTQLYMQSIEQSKAAYDAGMAKANDDTLAWVLKEAGSSQTISVLSLYQFLKGRSEELRTRNQEREGQTDSQMMGVEDPIQQFPEHSFPFGRPQFDPLAAVQLPNPCFAQHDVIGDIHTKKRARFGESEDVNEM